MFNAKSKTKTTPSAHTVVSLSQSSFVHNLREFQRLSYAVAPVLKSNAYGHGLIEIASLLKKENIPFLVVDSHEEALTLKENNIKTPILIIGYVLPETVNNPILKNTSFAITSFEMLHDWGDKVNKLTKIHLKIDTGMHRQGIALSQISESIQILKRSPFLVLEGIYSHFSDASNIDSTYTDAQIESWNNVVGTFKTSFSSILYFHISNSAGHGYIEKTVANVTRPGMGLYGFNGNGKIDILVNLRPVLELETLITGLKNIVSGSKIGYKGTFVSDSTKTIATIPVGYDIGLDRRLSNKGVVKIGDKYAKIIGIISMNTTIIDVTGIENVKLNTKVTVISRNAEDPNSMMNIAKDCGTIVDDIATGISPFIQRKIVD